MSPLLMPAGPDGNPGILVLAATPAEGDTRTPFTPAGSSELPLGPGGFFFRPDASPGDNVAGGHAKEPIR